MIPFSGGSLMDPRALQNLEKIADAVPQHLKNNNFMPTSLWLGLPQEKIHQMLIDLKLQKPEYKGNVIKKFLQK